MIRIKLLLFLSAITVAGFAFGLTKNHDPEPLSTEIGEKMNGVSFVGTRHETERTHLEPITRIHANWIAVIPYAFARAGEPSVTFNHRRQWWGERREGVITIINHAKSLGLNVMLKPHVWVRGQGWAGDFDLETEEEWTQWERDYRDYIITYSKLADSLDVELIAVGTEYKKAAVKRPDFWKALIGEVRSFYDGNITYAANWDNYHNITFWDHTDYIGIDAYFPTSGAQTPTPEQVRQGWDRHKAALKQFSNQHQKPVLFTEFGYESADFTADGHWKRDKDSLAVNLEAQANAYRGLFESLWDEPWFAGGFLWKWFPRHERAGGIADKRFTPQNKPAEETIKDWFQKYKDLPRRNSK